MKNLLYYNILVLLFPLLLFTSCEEVKGTPEEFITKQKTVLVYMAANNNLSEDARNNLAAMQQGYIPDEEGNLVVYYHYPNQNPLLFHIRHNEEGNVAIDTIYRFPSRNSATATSLTNAIQVTSAYFPAEEYGLILWSHATGWLPVNYYANNPQTASAQFAEQFALSNSPFANYDNGADPYADIVKMVKQNRNGILSRSFGSEENSEIDIKDVVKALPFKFSFIIFDACLMGGIEPAYQLKDSTDYILFSPTETLANGMPYASIMQHIFAQPTDLTAVAKEYYNFYNNQSSLRYATISLVKTSELEDLANAASEIFGKYRDSISTVKINNIQRYYRGNKHWFYDISDFIGQIAPKDEAEAFNKALDKAVIYKAATPYFIDIPINSFSGLSTYIPYFNETELDNYYKTLEWNKVCGMIE
ncbi:MAG: hypothetical protein IKY70_04165 [Bacteroidales bacterium]|nr:hypothetical protein [Bacteroidales bacterium]